MQLKEVQQRGTLIRNQNRSERRRKRFSPLLANPALVKRVRLRLSIGFPSCSGLSQQLTRSTAPDFDPHGLGHG